MNILKKLLNTLNPSCVTLDLKKSKLWFSDGNGNYFKLVSKEEYEEEKKLLREDNMLDKILDPKHKKK
jgi:hypothetical protein